MPLAARSTYLAAIMAVSGPHILRARIDRRQLATLAAEQFGDMIKATVDVAREVVALGGELHSDEEAILLDDGSSQADVGGVNFVARADGEHWQRSRSRAARLGTGSS